MDNELKKFREDAAKKYEQYRQQKEAEEAVKAFEESEKVAKELKITQETEDINTFCAASTPRILDANVLFCF